MSTAQTFRTRLTELTGVTHPIVQTGMGWVAGPRLVSATANAGALGILASATMTLAESAPRAERTLSASSWPTQTIHRYWSRSRSPIQLRPPCTPT